MFIHVDDLGWSEIGCNRGGETLGFADTPHIDQLAAAGVRFTDAYAASPVCAPTRGSIVSGQEPARHGVHDVTPQFTRPWQAVVQPPSNDKLPEGIRVPLIIRWPGHVAPGGVCNTAVISTDFYPTILAAAGIDPPRDRILDGVSLLPLLEQRGTVERNALMFYYPNFHMTTPAAAIREGPWKLIDYLGQDRTELYNLADDLGEQNDLSSKQPGMATALRNKLADHLRDLGAQMPRPNPDHDPEKADTWGPRIKDDRKWKNIP